MRALLIDPEARTISEIDFDGEEESIPRLLGCQEVVFEQWPRSWQRHLRIYSDINAVGNSELHGFWIPETGGTINHGLCLQINYDSGSRRLMDCAESLGDVKRQYRIYMPGRGVYSIYDYHRAGVRGPGDWK